MSRISRGREKKRVKGVLLCLCASLCQHVSKRRLVYTFKAKLSEIYFYFLARCRRKIHTRDRIGQYDQLHRQNELFFFFFSFHEKNEVTLLRWESKIVFSSEKSYQPWLLLGKSNAFRVALEWADFFTLFPVVSLRPRRVRGRRRRKRKEWGRGRSYEGQVVSLKKGFWSYKRIKRRV